MSKSDTVIVPAYEITLVVPPWMLLHFATTPEFLKVFRARMPKDEGSQRFLELLDRVYHQIVSSLLEHETYTYAHACATVDWYRENQCVPEDAADMRLIPLNVPENFERVQKVVTFFNENGGQHAAPSTPRQTH